MQRLNRWTRKARSIIAPLMTICLPIAPLSVLVDTQQIRSTKQYMHTCTMYARMKWTAVWENIESRLCLLRCENHFWTACCYSCTCNFRGSNHHMRIWVTVDGRLSKKVKETRWPAHEGRKQCGAADRWWTATEIEPRFPHPTPGPRTNYWHKKKPSATLSRIYANMIFGDIEEIYD